MFCKTSPSTGIATANTAAPAAFFLNAGAHENKHAGNTEKDWT